MESPDNPQDVAWYDFSAVPGTTGNAVFSGHLDWRTGVTGVFWRLKDLAPGDAIIVELADGTLKRFVVDWSDKFEGEAPPIAKIVGPTAGPAITLITCEGFFDRSARNYSDRRVVRAIQS